MTPLHPPILLHLSSTCKEIVIQANFVFYLDNSIYTQSRANLPPFLPQHKTLSFPFVRLTILCSGLAKQILVLC